MPFPRLETDLNNVQTLPNQPRAVDGWTPAVIKELLDKAPNDIKTHINTVLLPALENAIAGTSASEILGSAPIEGLAGSTIYAQIASLLAVAQAAQAGTILPGTVTDDKLSNTAGQLKSVVNEHLAENAQDAHGGINEGTANTDIQNVFTLPLPVDTRSLIPTAWTADNKPSTMEIRDGVTVLGTIGITYDTNGKITELTLTANGKTITYTQTFDASTGKFTGRTKAVV